MEEGPVQEPGDARPHGDGSNGDKQARAQLAKVLDQRHRAGRIPLPASFWNDCHDRAGACDPGQSARSGGDCSSTCSEAAGVSPFAEGRRATIERGSLLGVPAYRWLVARGSATVEYSAFARRSETMPAPTG